MDQSLLEDPYNIIVRMPNWLGDLVMATPILEQLKIKWPKAKITVMCPRALSVLLQKDPRVNGILSFNKAHGCFKSIKNRKIVRQLRNNEYDLGILLPNSFSSSWWFWRANVKFRIGFAGNYRSFLLNAAVPFPKNYKTQHLVEVYQNLLLPLGIDRTLHSPQLFVTEEEKMLAWQLLESHGCKEGDLILGMNPAAAFGPAKCWLEDRFRTLTQRLIKNPHMRIVYIGDTNGCELIKRICINLPKQVIDLSGKTTIRQLISLMTHFNLFLTNDSGPMHLAAALKVPLLALFGSTSEIRTGPYKNGEIIHKHVECSPCYQRVCPIDFRCMRQITLDEVHHKIQELLKMF